MIRSTTRRNIIRLASLVAIALLGFCLAWWGPWARHDGGLVVGVVFTAWMVQLAVGARLWGFRRFASQCIGAGVALGTALLSIYAHPALDIPGAAFQQFIFAGLGIGLGLLVLSVDAWLSLVAGTGHAAASALCTPQLTQPKASESVSPQLTGPKAATESCRPQPTGPEGP